jgi:hypothetical protein
MDGDSILFDEWMLSLCTVFLRPSCGAAFFLFCFVLFFSVAKLCFPYGPSLTIYLTTLLMDSKLLFIGDY